MTNMLQDGVVWLGGQLKDAAGLTITYSRGIQSVSLTATATLHQYEITEQDGFVTTFVSRDYLLHAADLVLDSTAVTPRAGDRIGETIAGTATTFEVVPVGDAPCYVHEDPDGTLLTVHTKKVSP